MVFPETHLNDWYGSNSQISLEVTSDKNYNNSIITPYL